MELERDEFGVTSFDAGSGILELDWTDATERMTDAQFRAALERFARHAVTQRARNVLIDVTRFAHKMSPEIGAWRDEHVIPLYNQAGVKKMAFLIPARRARHRGERRHSNGRAPRELPYRLLQLTPVRARLVCCALRPCQASILKSCMALPP